MCFAGQWANDSAQMKAKFFHLIQIKENALKHIVFMYLAAFNVFLMFRRLFSTG
jgi:hypothetical protein